jgi:tetratricopeptide (TPR) repeat protein
LLTNLARGLRESGALDAAETVIEEAVAAAKWAGDEPSEQRAEIERARERFMRTPIDAEALRAVARRAIAVFEADGTDADLADAWQMMGLAELSAGHRSAQLQALLRARDHAIASGDVRRQIDAWNEVGGSMLFGRTPVGEVLAFLDEELAWAREHALPAVEADALLGGPYLYSRLGRFDEARDRLERSKTICRELGSAYGLVEAHGAGAELEKLAGDLATAERELRKAIRIAAEMGASRYVALYRTRLAHVLVDLGRDDDARQELEQARAVSEGAAPWRTAQARLLARRGRSEEAAALARGAVASIAGSVDLTGRAEALTYLAEVLEASGDAAGAAEALAEALGLHEEKGNVLPAHRCRALLAAAGADQDLSGSTR